MISPEKRPVTARRLTPRERRHLKYLEKWQHSRDRERSLMRAKAVRRLITFWELIRECREWTPLNVLYPKDDHAERRWARRTIYTLEKAGLVEVEMMKREDGQGRINWFRVRKQH